MSNKNVPFSGHRGSICRPSVLPLEGSDSQIPRVFPPFPSQMFKKAPDLGFLPTLTAQPGSRPFSLEKSQYVPCHLIFSKSSGFWGHTVGLGQSFLLPPVYIMTWLKVLSHSPTLTALGELIPSHCSATSRPEICIGSWISSPRSQSSNPSAPQIQTSKSLLFPTPASSSGLATSISGLSSYGSLCLWPHTSLLLNSLVLPSFPLPNHNPARLCNTLHLYNPKNTALRLFILSVCSLVHVHWYPEEACHV